MPAGTVRSMPSTARVSPKRLLTPADDERGRCGRHRFVEDDGCRERVGHLVRGGRFGEQRLERRVGLGCEFDLGCGLDLEERRVGLGCDIDLGRDLHLGGRRIDRRTGRFDGVLGHLVVRLRRDEGFAHLDRRLGCDDPLGFYLRLRCDHRLGHDRLGRDLRLGYDLRLDDAGWAEPPVRSPASTGTEGAGSGGRGGITMSSGYVRGDGPVESAGSGGGGPTRSAGSGGGGPTRSAGSGGGGPAGPPGAAAAARVCRHPGRGGAARSLAAPRGARWTRRVRRLEEKTARSGLPRPRPQHRPGHPGRCRAASGRRLSPVKPTKSALQMHRGRHDVSAHQRLARYVTIRQRRTGIIYPHRWLRYHVPGTKECRFG